MPSLSLIYTVVKTVGPLSFGFLIGALISLSVFPTIKENQLGNDEEAPLCATADAYQAPESEPVIGGVWMGANERFEAIVHPPLQDPNGANRRTAPAKVNRPRFYATELDIRDKLFVAILTSNQQSPTLAIALNQTTSHHVSKLQFFTDNGPDHEATPPLNTVVLQSNAYNKAVKLLEHLVTSKLMTKYDWFYVAPATTYTKAFKLYELVTHISVGNRLIMGKKMADNPTACNLQAGILISRTALEDISSNLDRCRNAVNSELEDSENFARCLIAAASVNCSEDYNGKVFRSWQLEQQYPVTQNIAELSRYDAFNSALSVFPLTTDGDFYSLHKHFCELELEQLTLLTDQTEAAIQNLSAENGDGRDWPAAVPSMWKPKNRYEVFKWEFFTETQIFKNKQNENVEPLAASDKRDIDSIIEQAKTFIDDTTRGQEATMKFQRLLSGYRLFDPTRGMCYVLDMVYANATATVTRRLHVVRPLTKTEIIHDVPYVTEETNLTLIIPVDNGETGAAREFLLRYSRICLTDVLPRRHVRVVMALSRRRAAAETDNSDTAYVRMLADVAAMRERCRTGSYFDVLTVPPGSDRLLDPLTVVDTVVEHFGPNNIYVMLTPYMEFTNEFLNRVRINTIRNYQVFFPIPFVEYNPAVAGGHSSSSAVKPGHAARGGAPANPKNNAAQMPFRVLDVHKDKGHFDANDFSIASFYGAEYAARRSATGISTKVLDLGSLFVGAADLHLLRATDPHLKQRYHEKTCPAGLSESDYGRCLISRRESLGSKSQIAILVQDKITIKKKPLV